METSTYVAMAGGNDQKNRDSRNDAPSGEKEEDPLNTLAGESVVAGRSQELKTMNIGIMRR